MKTFFKSNRGWLVMALFILVAAMLITFIRTAQAQPYYTNTLTPGSGNYQYNQTFPTPLRPSTTITNQQAAGICNGSFTPGSVLSNSFPMIYSTAPSVVATGSASGTNQVIAVTSVTTTNFALSVPNTNGLTIYWVAVGH